MRQLSCSAAEYQKNPRKESQKSPQIQYSIQPRLPTPSSLTVVISFPHYTHPQPLMSASIHLMVSTLILLLL